MTPRVWIFAHCRNERYLAPFFLRHYETFAEQIHIFDDGSDDGTLEILRAHPKVTVHPIFIGGLNEQRLLELAYEWYPSARGRADFVMWPDMDEFIYHPRMLAALTWHRAHGVEAIRPLGFNVMGSVPVDDGRQIWQILRTGIRAEVYSKPVVFDPAVTIRWSLGKHKLVEPKPVMIPQEDPNLPSEYRLKLLHYRYLTPEYTEARHARQYARSPDKGTAWGCSPQYTGENSVGWVSRVLPHIYDVVEPNSVYRDTPETRDLAPL